MLALTFSHQSTIQPLEPAVRSPSRALRPGLDPLPLTDFAWLLVDQSTQRVPEKLKMTPFVRARISAELVGRRVDGCVCWCGRWSTLPGSRQGLVYYVVVPVYVGFIQPRGHYFSPYIYTNGVVCGWVIGFVGVAAFGCVNANVTLYGRVGGRAGGSGGLCLIICTCAFNAMCFSVLAVYLSVCVCVCVCLGLLRTGGTLYLLYAELIAWLWTRGLNAAWRFTP